MHHERYGVDSWCACVCVSFVSRLIPLFTVCAVFLAHTTFLTFSNCHSHFDGGDLSNMLISQVSSVPELQLLQTRKVDTFGSVHQLSENWTGLWWLAGRVTTIRARSTNWHSNQHLWMQMTLENPTTQIFTSGRGHPLVRQTLFLIIGKRWLTIKCPPSGGENCREIIISAFCHN